LPSRDAPISQQALRRGDPARVVQHQRHRVGQRPLPARDPRPRAFPDRTSRADSKGRRNTFLDEVFAMGRPALPMDLQRRFWSMMRTGIVLDDAAASVGVSKTVAWRWFREAGGVLPAASVKNQNANSRPTRLSFQEREEISYHRAAGEGVRTIARNLNRSPSTISRELVRGTVRRKTGYRASVAQARADARARRPKPALRIEPGTARWLLDRHAGLRCSR
jgi:IS30 family transposase